MRPKTINFAVTYINYDESDIRIDANASKFAVKGLSAPHKLRVAFYGKTIRF